MLSTSPGRDGGARTPSRRELFDPAAPPWAAAFALRRTRATKLANTRAKASGINISESLVDPREVHDPASGVVDLVRPISPSFSPTSRSPPPPPHPHLSLPLSLSLSVACREQGATHPSLKVRTKLTAGKHVRALTSKQARDQQRAHLGAQKRSSASAPPLLVAVLSLSAALPLPALWSLLTSTSTTTTTSEKNHQPSPTTIVLPDSSARITLLPPPDPSTRHDPLLLVDYARAADAVLLLIPADPTTPTREAIDDGGRLLLTILAAMGLPALHVLAVSSPNRLAQLDRDGDHHHHHHHPGVVDMKARAAAKKRAGAALGEALAGDHPIHVLESAPDVVSVYRRLVPLAGQVAKRPGHSGPPWRQARPYLVPHAARIGEETSFREGGGESTTTTVLLEGHVRGWNLNTTRTMHIGGVGDVRVRRIWRSTEPGVEVGNGPAHGREGKEKSFLGDGGEEGMVVDGTRTDDTHTPILVSEAGRDEPAEGLERENIPDDMMGEQTWPTEEELQAVAEERRQAALGAALSSSGKRVPKGTSTYQAAWIDDAEVELDPALHHDDDDDDMMNADEEVPALVSMRGGTEAEGGEFDVSVDDDGGEEEEEEEEEMETVGGVGSEAREAYLTALAYHKEEERLRREAAAEDGVFPDWVDLPPELAGRVRFEQYRGLKSFRTSPWDPRESLPRDYSRVFAFSSFARTKKLALERAHDPAQGVPVGTYAVVEIEVAKPEVARQLVARVAAAHGRDSEPLLPGEWRSAPPVTAFSNLQHECKLSVVNMAITKRPEYEEPVANKQPMLFVTGPRTFVSRPILSTDEHGMDKFKMERFLHPGRRTVASCYAPIAYPPLPVLAFVNRAQGGGRGGMQHLYPVLAATGAVKSCDPDRVVVKKAVLTGTPVRSHKNRCVVKYMFHNPEDVRWFTPVQLWTKGGRNGRIREAIGTHGSMKCVFDGPVPQHDTVCMALYKRVFPKWPTPEEMCFTYPVPPEPSRRDPPTNL